MANAINKLVHSVSVYGLATTLGPCSINTHNTNIAPANVAASLTLIPEIKLKAYAKKAMPTK